MAEQIKETGGAEALMALFRGGKGDTTTETTSSNITSQGLEAVIANILGGNEGLAAVAGGQRRAGLTNSSTNQLLVKELVSSAAAKASAMQAGTTRTTTKGGTSKGDVFKEMLAAQAIKKAAKMYNDYGSKSRKSETQKSSDSDTSSDPEQSITDKVMSLLGLTKESNTSASDPSITQEIAPEQSMSFPASDEAWTQLFDSFSTDLGGSENVDLGGTDFGSGMDTTIPSNDSSEYDWFYDMPSDSDEGFYMP